MAYDGHRLNNVVLIIIVVRWFRSSSLRCIGGSTSLLGHIYDDMAGVSQG